MSIKLMTAVWEHAPIRQGSLIVLLALADFANDSGRCWPSIPTLAKKARIGERHTRRILQELEEWGMIVKEKMPGRYESNIYRVLDPRGDIIAPLRCKSGVTFLTLRDDTQTPLTIK